MLVFCCEKQQAYGGWSGFMLIPKPYIVARQSFREPATNGSCNCHSRHFGKHFLLQKTSSTQNFIFGLAKGPRIHRFGSPMGKQV